MEFFFLRHAFFNALKLMLTKRQVYQKPGI